MRSAVEFYGCVDAGLAGTLAMIRTLLASMPDNGDDLWSCHAATRGFKAFLDLPFEVRDGFFAGRGVCHSWLEFVANGHRLALDILPMGAHGGPLVADIGGFAPWGRLYIEEPGYYDARLSGFDEEGRLFLEALRVSAAKAD